MKKLDEKNGLCLVYKLSCDCRSDGNKAGKKRIKKPNETRHRKHVEAPKPKNFRSNNSHAAEA